MRIPGEGGVGEREVRITGYADDLAAFLADERQLVRFKELLAVYERAAGRRMSGKRHMRSGLGRCATRRWYRGGGLTRRYLT